MPDFGEYLTPRFTEIWDNYADFAAEYRGNELGVCDELSAGETGDKNLKLLFYSLYSRFGNSPIASTDRNRFKYNLYSIIYNYAPTWIKRLSIQKKLRDLSDDEILAGSKQINNFAQNPSTEPSTSALEELTTINTQNTVNYKRSKLDAYTVLWSALRSDVTEEFLRTFDKLFLKVVATPYPVLYGYDIEENF